MVDFVKIREESKKKLEAAKATPTVILKRKPDYLMRVNHLLQYHLGLMTEWEQNFCYSNKEFMVNTQAVKDGQPEMLEHILTEKVKNKIAELEQAFCTSVCHALMNEGIPHA